MLISQTKESITIHAQTDFMKEINSGHSVDEIAERTGISTELADLICRMYLTHPGIDVDGMIRRLEERIPSE